MLQLKLPIVDTIHPQSNQSVTGIKIKAMGKSKLNKSPEYVGCFSALMTGYLSFVTVASLYKNEFE